MNTMPHAELLHPLKETDNRVQLSISVPKDLLYFQGHFPSIQILPGVVQVDWAIHFAHQYFTMPCHFASMELIKFQHIIHPGQTLALELDYSPEKSKLRFSYNSAEQKHSSGCIFWSD